LSRASSALGAGLGSLLAAGLFTVTAGALYLRIHNQGEDAAIRAPARDQAKVLADLVRVAARDPARIRAHVARMIPPGRSISGAAVVVEPRSVKYRFLRKRRYLAHTDEARQGQVLDRLRASDKAIYDLINRARRKGPQVVANSPAEGAFSVQAAEPVMVDGKHFATAIVFSQPKAPPVPAPAWPLGLGLGLCVLAGMIAGAISQRGRYLVVMAALAGHGAYSIKLLDKLARGYDIAFEHSWALAAALALGLVVVFLGLLGVGRRISASLTRHRFAYAYVAPAALGMLLLVFIPFGYGLGLGFFNHDHGSYTFVGLKNFAEILSGGGRPLSHPLNFYFTLGVTVLWTVTNVVLHVSIGLALALVLKDPLLRFKGVYRVLLILPWAVPNYITALIWKGMFHYQFGAVNHVLDLLGVEKVSWFSSFSTAFIANVTTNTWLGFPFMMVISLGALQSIPGDVYEAAAVDGASRWQSFWRITMPLLRPALFPAIVIGSIWTFNMFNIIYLVSEGAPAGASDILITEAYRWAFERADRYGLAAAYALIIFLILLGYTLVANRMSKATEDAY